MRHKLPPLNPLRVFVAVARSKNLTLAAQELHVSQSAVSRQIATLESYLGIELFRRERHGVTLTRAGNAYAAKVLPAFEMLSNATDTIISRRERRVLRLRTYTTFTAKWLIPRLPDFRERHPDIEVVITNAVPDVDFDRDAVDLAIQCGNGKWPRLDADFLFDDIIEPVCSPQLAERCLREKGSINGLLSERLLVSHYRRADWSDWLGATGRKGFSEHAERMIFSSSVLTWQAALDGLGVAVGQRIMLESEIKSGLLILPFKEPLQRRKGYYLVRPAKHRFSNRVASFRNWILNKVAKEHENSLEKARG